MKGRETPENLGRQYAEKIPVQPVTHVFNHVIKPVHLNMNRAIGGFTGSTADALVTAYIHRDSADQDGILYSTGQRFGGYSFYIKDNHLKYAYNANKFQYFEAISEIEVPFTFKGRAGKIVLQQFATEIDPALELAKLSSIE